MRTPASVIRKVVQKWFPYRGQATFCLTEREFKQRWDGVVSELSYDKILLSPFKQKLMERWARITDEDHAPRRVSNPTNIPKRALPKRVTPQIIKDINKFEKMHRTATKKDGYDMFRKPYEPLNRGRRTVGVYKSSGR